MYGLVLNKSIVLLFFCNGLSIYNSSLNFNPDEYSAGREWKLSRKHHRSNIHKGVGNGRWVELIDLSNTRPVISLNIADWSSYSQFGFLIGQGRHLPIQTTEFILQNPVRNDIFRQYKTQRGYKACTGKKGEGYCENRLSDLGVIISFVELRLQYTPPSTPYLLYAAA